MSSRRRCCTNHSLCLAKKFAEDRPKIAFSSPAIADLAPLICHGAVIAEVAVLSHAFVLKVLNRLTEWKSLVCTVPKDHVCPRLSWMFGKVPASIKAGLWLSEPGTSQYLCAHLLSSLLWAVYFTYLTVVCNTCKILKVTQNNGSILKPTQNKFLEPV